MDQLVRTMHSVWMRERVLITYTRKGSDTSTIGPATKLIFIRNVLFQIVPNSKRQGTTGEIPNRNSYESKLDTESVGRTCVVRCGVQPSTIGIKLLLKNRNDGVECDRSWFHKPREIQRVPRLCCNIGWVNGWWILESLNLSRRDSMRARLARSITFFLIALYSIRVRAHNA